MSNKEMVKWMLIYQLTKILYNRELQIIPAECDPQDAVKSVHRAGDFIRPHDQCPLEVFSRTSPGAALEWESLRYQR